MYLISGISWHQGRQGGQGLGSWQSQDAKGLGAKWPRYQGTWLLGMLGTV